MSRWILRLVLVVLVPLSWIAWQMFWQDTAWAWLAASYSLAMIFASLYMMKRKWQLFYVEHLLREGARFSFWWRGRFVLIMRAGVVALILWFPLITALALERAHIWYFLIIDAIVILLFARWFQRRADALFREQMAGHFANLWLILISVLVAGGAYIYAFYFTFPVSECLYLADRSTLLPSNMFTCAGAQAESTVASTGIILRIMAQIDIFQLYIVKIVTSWDIPVSLKILLWVLPITYGAFIFVGAGRALLGAARLFIVPFLLVVANAPAYADDGILPTALEHDATELERDVKAFDFPDTRRWMGRNVHKIHRKAGEHVSQYIEWHFTQPLHNEAARTKLCRAMPIHLNRFILDDYNVQLHELWIKLPKRAHKELDKFVARRIKQIIKTVYGNTITPNLWQRMRGLFGGKTKRDQITQYLRKSSNVKRRRIDEVFKLSDTLVTGARIVAALEPARKIQSDESNALSWVKAKWQDFIAWIVSLFKLSPSSPVQYDNLPLCHAVSLTRGVLEIALRNIINAHHDDYIARFEAQIDASKYIPSPHELLQ